MAQTTHLKSKKSVQYSQIWENLKIAWKGYKMAKLKSDKKGMTAYANRINELQHNIGAKLSKFPELT